MSGQLLPDIEELTRRVCLLEKLALLERHVPAKKGRELPRERSTLDQVLKVTEDIVASCSNVSPKERGRLLAQAMIHQATNLHSAKGAHPHSVKKLLRIDWASVQDRDALAALAKREKAVSQRVRIAPAVPGGCEGNGVRVMTQFVSASNIAKKVGLCAASVLAYWGDELGLAGPNGTRLFNEEAVAEILRWANDRDAIEATYPYRIVDIASATGLHKKTAAAKFGHLGVKIRGAFRFTEAALQNIRRSTWQCHYPEEYDMSLLEAAQLLNCHRDTASRMLRGLGIIKGRQRFYIASAVVELAAKRRSVEWINVTEAWHMLGVTAAQFLYLFNGMNSVGCSPTTGAHYHSGVEFRDRFPYSTFTSEGHRWKRGTMEAWAEVFKADPAKFLTSFSLDVYNKCGIAGKEPASVVRTMSSLSVVRPGATNKSLLDETHEDRVAALRARVGLN